MERISLTMAGQKALVVPTKVLIGAIVITFLYLGRPILVPLTLAIFLALVLTPLITVLHRLHLHRMLSVVLVVLLVTVALGGVIMLVSMQLASLIDELPTHTENIRSKVRSVRDLGQGDFFDRMDRMWTELSTEWNQQALVEVRLPVETVTSPTDSTQLTPVIVQRVGPSWTNQLAKLLGSALSGAVSLGLALVLSCFILLRREDLRNRLIRFVGGSLIVTTKALDDVGERISRYLRMQLIVNSSYGVVWGLGLYFIGLDYAALWGFLAAVLRYVPYAGPWISALVPLTLSLAQFPGWFGPLMILALLIVLELVSNNVLEPVLYGHRTGVSGVAMLVSAAFWTFLWGPVGLMLSGPITVCLAVVGKFFPQAAFLDLLLGDEPVLEPHVSYYQRLVARDQDEATQLVLAKTKTTSIDQVFDEILIPALNLMKRDRERVDVSEADENYVVETTREIIELLDTSDSGPAVEVSGEDPDAQASARSDSKPRVRLMGFPARDAEDQLALEMLQRMLDDREWDFEIESARGALTSEWVESVAKRRPAIVCVASLPPGGLAHTRYVCMKLKNRCPDIRIIVGRWGLHADIEADHEHLESVGADQMATTLRETRDQLKSWLPIVAEQQAIDSAIREPIADISPNTGREQGSVAKD